MLLGTKQSTVSPGAYVV